MTTNERAELNWALAEIRKLQALIGGVGGAAGGDLSGTFPNPSVVNDSHTHTAATLPASFPPPDGDKGDITVSGSGAAWAIDNNVVTDAKLRQGVSRSVIGVTGSSTANVADIQATGADQVLRVNTVNTGVSFGPLNLAGSNAVTGALAANRGGTGNSSYAVGDLLYASASTTISKLADVATGNALISGGVGVAPSYGKIGLATHISGTLPIANGGTGGTTAAAAFNALAPTQTGQAGEFLTTDGANASWQALPAGLSDGDKGDITVSGSGAAWAVDNDVVSNAKAANMATQTFKGRNTAGTGDPEDLSILTVQGMILTDATESVKGIAALATQAIVTTGTNDAQIVTPLKLTTALTNNTKIIKLKAGTASANTAPMEFVSGALNTTPEAGAMEYLSGQPYFTDDVPTRYSIIIGNDNAVSPTLNPTPIITDFYGSNGGVALCEPDEWIEIKVNEQIYLIPAYAKP